MSSNGIASKEREEALEKGGVCEEWVYLGSEEANSGRELPCFMKKGV
ncbi:MAG: hypothetical protein HQK50_07905 [Oligoflexia bacterium]|nr:hypothetical protein [Oligoflexia bacterium]